MVPDPYHGVVPFSCDHPYPLWLGGAVRCWVAIVAIAAYRAGRRRGRPNGR
jgi:hypothetical protein